MAALSDGPLIERLAELAVTFGANVQPGQVVGVTAEVGNEAFVRAVAAQAYGRGARFVDASYFDPYVKRARIEHADEETLAYVPPWYGDRWLGIADERGAYVALTGPTAPGLLDDLDPERAGRDRLPSVKEAVQVVNDRTINWTIVPCPTPGWAALVFPDAEPGEGLRRLEDALVHVCRLDESDPVVAWQERMDVTVGAAARLSERRFDALRFRGPGTDLTIGLLPSSRWFAARFETVDGLVHHPNLPSEEVFTTPDPERTDGVVTSTKPLVFPDGSVVRGLRVRFEGGRAVEIDADEGAGNLRARTAADEGGTRLGEVALVDGAGRIGPLETVFYDTLLDENAASHIALGAGFPFAVAPDDAPRVNESAIHVDFMIGGPAVEVFGLERDGGEVPVLVGGAWEV